MKGLDELKYSWNEFAESDAMGAVLTGNDWDEAAFYDSGRAEVDSLMKAIEGLYPDMKKDSALDFGCGLGRLTFALAGHFSRVTGIDISSKMIERATSNRRNVDGVEFVLNETDSLKKIPSDSVDFLLSLIVLQHIPKKFIKGYLREFLRVAKPGGLIVFQIPTRKFLGEKVRYWEGRPLNWDSPSLGTLCYRAVTRFVRWIPRKIREIVLRNETLCRIVFFFKPWDGKPLMQMNTMKKSSLERFLARQGGQIVKSKRDTAAGDRIESYTYFVKKSSTGFEPVLPK